MVFLCSAFFFVTYLLTQADARTGSRIIGGNNAYAGQFPHAAAITVQTSNSRIFCGGTLINNEWVLTAGQCVDGATLFTIQLGSNNLNTDDPNRVTVASSEYFLHPDYNPSTLENDIGLIKLRLPVEYTSYLNKVHFLGDHYVVPSTTAVVIGWGQTSDDDPEFSNDLKWVTVAALSNEECRLTYGNQITDSTLCVEGNYNEGSCYGDTGSGLFQSVGPGYMMHSGVASFISGNGCESTDPSGYVRTAAYRAWIKNITGV
ncbi:brachyurin-like [Zophobas morio]|uniref:brachyurin-like n=1 Tax=Zophobas morio TaxID=2755281 RepID=UPI0030839BAF